MIRGKALIAGILFPLLAIVTAYALLAPHDGVSGRRVVAEFVNAGLLAPGHDVRVGGATVGSVATMTVTDRGTARVVLDLREDVALGQDATASVRPQDLLGSVYLALAPGRSAAPLDGTIPVGRTFIGTSAEELFDTFDQPTRLALQTMLVELGAALDARGADLNEAVLHLAPVLAEVERVSGQLGAQNAELRRFVDSSSALTGQLAPRARDIKRLITGLNTTLQTTATRADALDEGLRRLPATLTETRTTLAELDRTARAATPLARQVQAVAPSLSSAVTSVKPFAAAAAPALRELDPVLKTTADTLAAGRRSLPRLAEAVRTLRSIAPPLAALTRTLVQPVGRDQSLITWTVQGVAAGLGGLAAEPGAEGHHSMRATVVIGCEMFGVPIRPGCLADLLQQAVAAPADDTSRKRTPRRGTARPPAPSPRGDAVPPVVPPVANTLDGLLKKAPTGGPLPSVDVAAVLDYLLGP